MKMTRPQLALRRIPLLLLSVSACLALSACGGGNGPDPNPNNKDTSSGSGSTGTTTASSTLTLGMNSRTVTLGQAVAVKAVLLDAAGVPLAGRVVKFSVDATLATLTPASGAALTDSSGTATVQLNAAGISANGAGYVSASFKEGQTDLSQSLGFQLGSVNVTLGEITLSNSSISAYATTSVSVPVLVNGVASTSPMTVGFSSPCSLSGKASIDASVSSINGVASATYTDKGCAGSDLITASINNGASSKQASLAVQAPAATSLQYSTVTPADGVITLKGYGTQIRPELAQVTFKLVDAQGIGVAGRTLQFSLSTTTGGIRFDNQLTTSSAITNSAGEARVTVQSGSLPTPVRVVASDVSAGLTTQSSGLSISSGFPDQDSVSVSAEVFNLDGWAIDNVADPITISLADHFNNPVPDGTAVTVVTNAGRIGTGTTGECKTVNSTCTLNFYSQQPRPANGRVQITAYAVGEETFIDRNGNNAVDAATEMIDINNASSDIGEAYVDVNEDRLYTAGTDIPIDFNSNGVYDGPDGGYNGTLCASSFSGCSSRRFTHVYGMITLVLADAHSAPLHDYVDLASGYPNLGSTRIALGCDSSTALGIYLRDRRGNILPVDSEVTFKLSGPGAGDFTLSEPSTFKVPNAAPPAHERLNGATVFPVRVFSPASTTSTDSSTGVTTTTCTASNAELSVEINAKTSGGGTIAYASSSVSLSAR